MRPVSEILKAYAIGDHLTDGEVVTLRDLYHDVVEATKPFGARYQLVRSDAVLNEAALNGFIRARGLAHVDA